MIRKPLFLSVLTVILTTALLTASGARPQLNCSTGPNSVQCGNTGSITGSITGAIGQALSYIATAASQAASTIAGVDVNLTAAPAVAGNTNAGAANGGNVNLTAGSAARFTSGNANGGLVKMKMGGGVGIGLPSMVDIEGFTGSGFLTAPPTSDEPILGLNNGNSGSQRPAIIFFGNRTADSDLGIIRFYNGTNSGSEVADIDVFRQTANNSGQIVFKTANAGSLASALTLNNDQSMSAGGKVLGPSITTSSSTGFDNLCWNTGTGEFVADSGACLTFERAYASAARQLRSQGEEIRELRAEVAEMKAMLRRD